jgi:hypothetical protein
MEYVGSRKLKVNLQIKLLIASVLALAILATLQVGGVMRPPQEAYFGLSFFSLLMFNHIAYSQ